MRHTVLEVLKKLQACLVRAPEIWIHIVIELSDTAIPLEPRHLLERDVWVSHTFTGKIAHGYPYVRICSKLWAKSTKWAFCTMRWGEFGCLTSHQKIFQSYMWRHINVQADWRSWTHGHLCTVIYMTEISLIVTLNNKFTTMRNFLAHEVPAEVIWWMYPQMSTALDIC